jgi:hypothetical protein
MWVRPRSGIRVRSPARLGKAIGCPGTGAALVLLNQEGAATSPAQWRSPAPDGDMHGFRWPPSFPGRELGEPVPV